MQIEVLKPLQLKQSRVASFRVVYWDYYTYYYTYYFFIIIPDEFYKIIILPSGILLPSFILLDIVLVQQRWS